MALLIAIRTVS